MTIRGHCDCRNIELCWHTRDYSVVPRACQCQHCLPIHAAYVSKSGTRVDITVRNETMHQTHRQGSEHAEFHVCKNCNALVFVTARIDGDEYCALNANYLDNPHGFNPPVEMTLFDQSGTEKLERWRLNWCHPVHVRGITSGTHRMC